MALACEKIANLSIKFATTPSDPRLLSLEPKEKTLLRFFIERNRPVKPKEIAEIFHVKPITITKWSKTWLDKEIIEGASGEKRITSYRIGEVYKDLTLNDLGYKTN